MIKAVIIINNHGKGRLTKFYERLDEKQQQDIIRYCFQVVGKRTDRVCNFVEVGDDPATEFAGKGSKLIYRHYATLYFLFLVDSAESELGILDLIQVFVETLDKCFLNVCELDLIFHSEKVHFILDEIIMGGMVLETNVNEVLIAIEAMAKLENSNRLAFFGKQS